MLSRPAWGRGFPVISWQVALLFCVALAIIVGLLGYWIVWIGEGSFLGSRAVRWLYDWGAPTYDGVKQYDPLDEAAFLGNPLFTRLEEQSGPRSLVLDVATGTARLPLALLTIPFYGGELVGVDLSRRMLAEAARKSAPYAGRATFLHHPAVPLPFDDALFDAVTSLEALEFMPDRRAALREMVRVLRPGGWLIVTNRIGSDARLMPGHTDSPEAFEAFLVSLGLVEVGTRPWQEIYDLIFARKVGAASAGRGLSGAWQAALRCPRCGKGLPAPDAEAPGWRCPHCDGGWHVAADGVWEAG